MQNAGSPVLDFDEALTLMANPYRRRLLVTIMKDNPENETDIPEDLATSDEELNQLLVEMRHTHLPKLEKLGVVDWDREENVVRRGPTFDDLRPLLELVENHRDELPAGWV